jgi:hypothetical protein
MNHMEVDMAYRVAKKYELVDLSQLVGVDFYHLEHYHPYDSDDYRFSSSQTSRKENPFEVRFDQNKELHPNSENWGLIQYPLEVLPHSPKSSTLKTPKRSRKISEWPLFILLVILTRTQIVWDGLLLSVINLIKAARRCLFHFRFYALWSHRAKVVREAVRGQSFVCWPRLLRALWINRTSAQTKKEKSSLNGVRTRTKSQ